MSSAAVESFVAADLVQRLASQTPSACESRFHGAVLFADISGFVEITEQFSKDGELGLDRLRLLLNDSFSQYVEQVDANGGQIAQFTGDGLVAYWVAPAQDVAGCVEQALAAAAALHGVRLNGDIGRLVKLHIGVSAGALWAARVGGMDGRWELLLGGPAVHEAAKAESRARRQQTQLGDGALAAVSASWRSMIGQQSTSQPPVSTWRLRELDADWLSSLVPRAVREAAPSDDGSWLAELRQVSCLFCRIEGLDEMRPEALGHFQRAARTIQDTVRSLSSSMGKLEIDDKGLVYHVVFGEPFNAHSDDGERAVRTGLALEKSLRAIGLSSSLGLASGRAFCGVIGSALRRQFVIVGRPMNLAARLMGVASGCLLCADRTAFAAGSDHEVVETHSLRPKGLNDTLQAYRVQRRAERRTRPHLCGRAHEQGELDALLGALEEGNGHVLSITGDPGLGKSTLLQELVARARRRNIAAATGAADSGLNATYRAWRGVFASILGLSASSDVEEQRRIVLERLAPFAELSARAPLLNAVVPLELPETEATRHLSGRSRADATLFFLVGCLDAVGTKPLVVVLEDAHWMDPASWDVLLAAAERIEGVLFVTAQRPMGAHPGLQGLVKLPRARTLELQPLAQTELGQLVGDVIGGAAAPELVATVFRRTQGNPLFAREYALLLKEKGRLVEHAGGWEVIQDGVGALGALSVPSTVEGMITSRIDNLPAAERLALKVASIVGQNFDEALLAAVYPDRENANALGALLASLRLRRLIEPTSTGGWAFCHAIIRDVAYGLVLVATRQPLHAAIAEALEAQAVGVAADYARLAHHWSLAQNPSQTARCANLAASNALRTGAYADALNLLKTCIDLAECGAVKATKGRRLRWQRQLADAHAGLGDPSARDEAANRGLVRALGPLRARRPISTLEALVRVCSGSLLRRFAATESLEDNLDLELARLHRHRCDVSYYRGDAFAVLSELLSAMAYGQRAPRSADLSIVYAQFSASVSLAGLHQLAKRLLARAIAVANEVDDPPSTAFAHLMRALYSVGQAGWSDTEQSCDACQRICLTVGDRTNFGHAQIIRFWMHYYRGELPQARLTADGLLENSGQSGNLQQRVWGLRCAGLIELTLGDVTSARARLEEAVGRLPRSAQQNELFFVWGLLALACLRSADRESAFDAAQRALDIGAKIGPTAHSTSIPWAGLIEVFIAARQLNDRRADWTALTRQALAGLARHRRTFPVAEPTYRYFRGVVELEERRSEAARRSLRQGLAAAQRLGMMLEAARIAARLREMQSGRMADPERDQINR